MYLIIFHIWINYYGFSTFEYILWKREKYLKMLQLKNKEII